MNRRDFFRSLLLGGTAFAVKTLFPQSNENHVIVEEAVEVTRPPLSDQLTWTLSPFYGNHLDGTLPDHLRFKVNARCEGTLFGATSLGTVYRPAV